MTESPRPPRSDDPRSPALVGWVLVIGLVALVAEVLLFAAAAQLAHRAVGGGVLGVVVAGLAVLVAGVLWGLFLAPKAKYRLPLVARVAIIGIAGVALGLGLRATRSSTWGLVVMAASILLMVLQWITGLREERLQREAEKARTDCFPGDPS